MMKLSFLPLLFVSSYAFSTFKTPRTVQMSMKLDNQLSDTSVRSIKSSNELNKEKIMSIFKNFGVGMAVSSSVILGENLQKSNAYDELVRELQQDQRPNKLDAAVIVNGNPPNYQDVRKDIAELVSTKPDKGPTLVRLAWHSSGTYDKITKTGGSGKGTIRFKEELDHGANGGLDMPVTWLESIYKKYNKKTDLSYADLYTLAGVVAIETMGGPKIPWRAGRMDSFDPKDVTPNGRLPDADKGSPQKTAAGLREIFGRMGFNDQEIVVLSGAHALGRCHATASGYVGPWTPTPTTFNNLYYTLLKGLKWTPNPKSGKFQYQDPSGKLMMLPSDLVLIEDEGFKKYVDIYAKDNKKFFADFSAAFQKLEELGTSGLYDV